MPETPSLIHYTEGGPWFQETKRCPYADEWFAELREMLIDPINPQGNQTTRS